MCDVRMLAFESRRNGVDVRRNGNARFSERFSGYVVALREYWVDLQKSVFSSSRRKLFEFDKCCQHVR